MLRLAATVRATDLPSSEWRTCVEILRIAAHGYIEEVQMQSDNVKSEQPTTAKIPVQKREISAFTGATTGKLFNKV